MVPKHITYIYSTKETVGFSWDDSIEERLTKQIQVTPAFPSDSDNKKTLETGRKWAEARTKKKLYNPETDRCDKIQNHNITEDKIINCPMSGVKIVSLEHRGEGGRAYKVVADGYYFDLREDVLLDIIQESSIIKGVIKCKLIWCKIGSQMKLVRVNSELHKWAIEHEEEMKLKPIPLKKLKIGYVYSTRNGSNYLYLGKVKSVKNNGGSEYSWNTKQHIYRELWQEIEGYLWIFVLSKINNKGEFLQSIKCNMDYNPGISISADIVKSRAVFKEEKDLKLDLKELQDFILKHADSKHRFYNHRLKDILDAVNI